MDGATLRSGAIANVHRVRNPIFAARKVMENSKHVFFVGEGAEDFARQEGLELVDPSYFSTEARREQLLRVQRETPEPPCWTMTARPWWRAASPRRPTRWTPTSSARWARWRSTPRQPGRGHVHRRNHQQADRPRRRRSADRRRHASNKTCAVSATGTGEMFIRMVAAYDVAAQMEYAGASLAQAADSVVMDKLPTIEGKGRPGGRGRAGQRGPAVQHRRHVPRLWPGGRSARRGHLSLRRAASPGAAGSRRALHAVRPSRAAGRVLGIEERWLIALTAWRCRITAWSRSTT